MRRVRQAIPRRFVSLSQPWFLETCRFIVFSDSFGCSARIRRWCGVVLSLWVWREHFKEMRCGYIPYHTSALIVVFYRRCDWSGDGDACFLHTIRLSNKMRQDIQCSSGLYHNSLQTQQRDLWLGPRHCVKFWQSAWCNLWSSLLLPLSCKQVIEKWDSGVHGLHLRSRKGQVVGCRKQGVRLVWVIEESGCR